MSDTDMTPEVAAGNPVDATVSTEKKSFLATGSGKAVVIVVALGALAVIAGVVVALVLFVFGKSAVEDMDITITPSTPTTTETPTSTQEAGPAEAVTNSEVFTFRDIFEPLIVEVVEPTTSTTPTDTANTSVAGTLTLVRVDVQDGAYVAVLTLDGVTYSLRDGERVGDSPWQVVTVREDSVVMIYGETQVVLSIGQSRTK